MLSVSPLQDPHKNVNFDSNLTRREGIFVNHIADFGPNVPRKWHKSHKDGSATLEKKNTQKTSPKTKVCAM